MVCKYLSGSAQRPYCLAYHQLMTPSVYELQTFCHGDPSVCLIYQEKEQSLPQPAEVMFAQNGAAKVLTKAV